MHTWAASCTTREETSQTHAWRGNQSESEKLASKSTTNHAPATIQACCSASHSPAALSLRRA